MKPTRNKAIATLRDIICGVGILTAMTGIFRAAEALTGEVMRAGDAVSAGAVILIGVAAIAASGIFEF